MKDILNEAIKKTLEKIYAQREEILTAFIAKYGCDPDHVVQIEEYVYDGSTSWYVRKMSDEEYERRKDPLPVKFAAPVEFPCKEKTHTKYIGIGGFGVL